MPDGTPEGGRWVEVPTDAFGFPALLRACRDALCGVALIEVCDTNRICFHSIRLTPDQELHTRSLTDEELSAAVCRWVTAPSE